MTSNRRSIEKSKK